MAFPSRLFVTPLAGLLCGASLLRADTGTWGFQAGGVLPQGSARQWIGSGSGPALDLLDSFRLDSGDAVRMRMGWFAFKANGTAPQVLALPGAAATSYPASSSNTLWGITYGAEYVHFFPGSPLYLLGGAGAAYLNATREGTIDLSLAAIGPAAFRYSANNLVPYFCLGAGYRFNHSLALEGRYQWSVMHDQVRGVDLTKAGVANPGTASFSGISGSTLGLGLVVSF